MHAGTLVCVASPLRKLCFLESNRQGLDLAVCTCRYVHRQTFEAPPATAALPPRGHLVFNSAFEGGNVLAARRLDDGNEYELTLRHDANNPKCAAAVVSCSYVTASSCVHGHEWALEIEARAGRMHCHSIWQFPAARSRTMIGHFGSQN